MGIFDQFKMASDMMKNMSPEQIQQLMKQAEEHKRVLEDTVRKLVDEEVSRRDLVSRKDVEKMLGSR